MMAELNGMYASIDLDEFMNIYVILDILHTSELNVKLCVKYETGVSVILSIIFIMQPRRCGWGYVSVCNDSV